MPTLEQVENASHEQLGRWYRFLPSPKDDAEVEVMNRLVERFREMGSFTPALSKKIGLDP